MSESKDLSFQLETTGEALDGRDDPYGPYDPSQYHNPYIQEEEEDEEEEEDFTMMSIAERVIARRSILSPAGEELSNKLIVLEQLGNLKVPWNNIDHELLERFVNRIIELNSNCEDQIELIDQMLQEQTVRAEARLERYHLRQD